MALDEEQRRKIEQNRLEALKKLEERKRKLSQLENERTTQPTAPTVNAPKYTKIGIDLDTRITASKTIPSTISKTFFEPQNTQQTSKSSLSVGSGIRPHTQLVSSTHFSITATSSVSAICSQFFKELAKFNRQDNLWIVPLEKYNYLVERLAVNEKPQAPNTIPKSVLTAFEPSQQMQRLAASKADYRLEDRLEPNLYNSLFPFQRDGVNAAIARRGRLIIADEMGLGKSIQAIAVVCYFRNEWPLLILAPASMVASWHEQILRWIGDSTVSPADVEVIYDGKVSSLTGLITILSYDLAVKLAHLIEKRSYRIIIADECHALRNAETKRTKTLVPFLIAADRAILLSGTPVLSRPVELFPQIQAVASKLFPKFREYGLRYCEGHQGHFGWDYRGSSNAAELQVVLENCVMIRRLKDQVMTQLPRKIRHQIFLKLPTATKSFKLFQMQANEFLTDVNRAEAELEHLQKKAEFMALWAQTGVVKLPAMMEYVEDLLDANHKMLIFAHHRTALDGFSTHFVARKIKYIRIDGRTPPSDRQNLCTQFQESEDIRIALLSITAASTGLTLTKATTVIFSELFFNPGVLVQAEDRAHRIGQVDSVNVHYLLAKGTTDDHVWPLILKKLNTLESVGLGKNDFKDMSSREHEHGQTTIERFFTRDRIQPEADVDKEFAAENDFINPTDLTED